MTEEELIRRAAQGDQDAFAELLELHQGKVYSLTLRMVENPEDAAELTQETFFNAWRGLPRFHGESKFSTWLYRLATNAAIDFLRKEKRRRTARITPLVAPDGSEPAADIPDHRFTPQGELERKELRQAIERGLGRLSEEHRQVLLLREVGGLSYGEIAQALSIEEGTVKSRISRARMALRQALLADGNFSAPASSMKTK